jgi:hypothetical protein
MQVVASCFARERFRNGGMSVNAIVTHVPIAIPITVLPMSQPMIALPMSAPIQRAPSSSRSVIPANLRPKQTRDGLEIVKQSERMALRNMVVEPLRVCRSRLQFGDEGAELAELFRLLPHVLDQHFGVPIAFSGEPGSVGYGV